MQLAPKNIVLKNGREIILRSASPLDAENMLRHLKITHTESYKNLNQSAEHWNKVSVSEEEKVLAGFESSPSQFMLIAVFEDRIVGGLGFWGYQVEFIKRTAWFGMSIQKEFCGSGLGTEMLKYMFTQAKEMGLRRIEMTVRTYNEAGIKLYEKMGFERIGLLKDAAFIDGQFVNEYSYQKILE
jgi:RimJ/RimL family protein N-acetyltransferase